MADAAGQATREPDLSARRLTQLKWLTTIAPAVAVFLYETVRHDILGHRFPTAYGNLAIGFINKLAPIVPVYFISAPYLVMGGTILFYLGIASLLSLYADAFGPIFR